MTVALPDLITGYLAEMRGGLRAPAAEAELILAEAEDHLCETAAAGMAVGMTELEAQRAAISSFGPVRTVVRAHGRRALTARDAAMAAWKLTGLLAMTIAAGGRVQLPREMTRRLGMRKRAELQEEPDHIGVWPGQTADQEGE